MSSISEMGDLIITDEQEGLKCYHYKDSDVSTLVNNPDLASYRGIITSNDAIVCKSFPFTPEVTTNDANLPDLLKPYLENLSAVKIFDSYEGTLLRLWFDETNNKWRLSTHRKIDAFMSYWGSDTSYGQHFIQSLASEFKEETTDVFEAFVKKLNPNKIYIFLLRSGKENRIVCNIYSAIKLFIVGTFDRTSCSEQHSCDRGFSYEYGAPETGLSCPEESTIIFDDEYFDDTQNSFTGLCSSTSNYDRIVEYVLTLDPFEKQGVVLITKDGRSIKVMNPDYERLFKIRNNNPNLIKRYIEVRKTPLQEEFFKLYSDKMELFDDFDDVFIDICNNIYKKYINRYIRKRVAILAPEQYKIMKEVHSDYVATHVKITLQTVENKLNEQEPKQLYYIYHQYKLRQEEFGDGNMIAKEDADWLFSQIKNQKV